jgi:uncharacterized protein YciW
MTSHHEFTFTLLATAGLEPTDEIQKVLSARDELMALSQEAHEACIVPNNPGGLSHQERAALASRMCTLNSESKLANYYLDMIPIGDSTRVMADPLVHITDTERLNIMLRHADLITIQPKDASESDIRQLEENGFNAADIVRLSELIAFVNYTIRVVKGVRLMEGLL